MAIVGNAYVVVHAITTGFSKDVDDALKNINRSASNAGKTIGKSFSSSATSGMSSFKSQADATYQSINRLIESGYYVQAAIASLVPVLASAAAGLFALGAQAAAAAPSLIVLPSIFSAMLQAMGTVKLAFGGIGKAISGLTKQAAGGAKAAKVDKMPALLNAVDNAQARLERAIRRSTSAQKDYNDALKDAAERFEELQFDAEDAALGEKKASLELEKARATLQRVQDLPPNSRARREAELAYQEADLAYRRAKDKNQELGEQAKMTKEQFIAQDRQVISAQEAQIEATASQIEAEEALAIATKKAKEEEKKQKKGDTGGGGGGADPLAGLSKEAAEFAKYIAGLKPKIQELRAAAGKELFPRLEVAVQNLVDNLFPKLIPILEGTGKALGNAAIDFSKVVTEADNLKNLDTVAKTNEDTIGKLGKVAGNLYSVFLSLLSAADPLIRRFTDWVVTLTDGWKQSVEAKNKTGELTDMFNKAGDIAADFGEIIGNIGGAFYNMGVAAAGPGSGGQLILDYLKDATQKFQDFTKTASEDGSLEQYFLKAAENFTKILEVIGKITQAVLRTADAEGTGKFLDALAKGADILGDALNKLVDAGIGEVFGKFIEKIAELMALTTDSASLKLYFGIMNTALGLLVKVLSNPIAQKLLILAAAAHGVRTAFSRVGKIINTATDYVKGSYNAMKTGIGTIKKYGGAMKNVAGNFSAARSMGLGYFQSLKMTIGYTKIGAAVTKVWTKVQAAFQAVMKASPIFLYIAAIAALIAIVVIMYKKFDWFREFVHKVWDGIKTAAEIVWAAIKIAFDKAWEPLRTAIEVGWAVIKVIFEAFRTVFEIAWEGIKKYFEIVWGIIKTAIEVGWAIIKPIFEAFRTVFELAWEGIKKYFEIAWAVVRTGIEVAWAIIKPIFEAFKTVFETAWNGIKTVFETIWGGIKKTIEGVFGFFSEVFGKVRDFVAGVLTGIVDGVKNLPGRLLEFIGKIKDGALGIGKSILQGFIDGLSSIVGGAADFAGKVGDAVFGAIKRAWNGFIDGINRLVPDKIDLPGPFDINLPDNPFSFLKLAKGGIVPAAPGGSLAVIGEAGRPERVEPLDPDGLSKRDKAMIKFLTGGIAGGGATINVYPSPGMDEVELAALVNRQISFQLRRGST